MQHFDALGICISNDARLYYRQWCVYTYQRGLQCCLFRIEGHARTSDGGTAIVQSRFFLLYLAAYNTPFKTYTSKNLTLHLLHE